MLSSDYLFLLLIILASVGLYLGMKSKRRWLSISCYAIATLVFIMYIVDMKTAWLDFAWVWLVPHPSVIILQIAAVWGVCIAVLLSLAGYLPERRNRRAVYLIAILTAGWGVYQVWKQLEVPPVSQSTWWYGEVLMQSTGSTCIAAATCTYLRTRDIAMEEQEAVKLGLISTDGGAMTNAWRILKLKLPAAEVHLSPLSLEELAASGRWYVTSVRYSMLEGHAIVVKASPDGRTIHVRDPLQGESEITREQFAERWLHDCVWIED